MLISVFTGGEPREFRPFAVRIRIETELDYRELVRFASRVGVDARRSLSLAAFGDDSVGIADVEPTRPGRKFGEADPSTTNPFTSRYP